MNRDIGPAATDEPAEYSIFYFNCADGTTVDFDLEIELYNVYNGRNNYLSGTARRPPWFCCGSCGLTRGGCCAAGDVNLPSIWFGFSFLFLIGLVYWALHLRNSWQHKQSIHLLMTVLVTLKVLTMAVDGLKLGVMRDTGEGSGWDYIWYFLYAVKGGTLFIVIVLIGSGWSFVKPFLSERDKRIVMVILPLQVINNIGARRPAAPLPQHRARSALSKPGGATET